MHTVFIGIGSNLADPVEQVRQACETIKGSSWCHNLTVSSLYRSVAVGPPQPDYINAVAQFTTALAPLALLDALQEVENLYGRQRSIRWGPRTLDLDILLFDQLTIDDPRLQVPHPYLAQRNFVVVPLCELAPELVLPGGSSIRELATRIGHAALTRLAEP